MNAQQILSMIAPSGRTATAWTLIAGLLSLGGVTGLTLVLSALIGCVGILSENLVEFARVWTGTSAQPEQPAASKWEILDRLKTDEEMRLVVSQFLNGGVSPPV